MRLCVSLKKASGSFNKICQSRCDGEKEKGGVKVYLNV